MLYEQQRVRKCTRVMPTIVTANYFKAMSLTSSVNSIVHTTKSFSPHFCVSWKAYLPAFSAITIDEVLIFRPTAGLVESCWLAIHFHKFESRWCYTTCVSFVFISLTMSAAVVVNCATTHPSLAITFIFMLRTELRGHFPPRYYFLLTCVSFDSDEPELLFSMMSAATQSTVKR